MNRETYNRLFNVDYSRTQMQIMNFLKRYSVRNDENRGNRMKREPLYCDAMGCAGILFFMMLDETISSIDSYQNVFKKMISEEIKFYDATMNQECIGVFIDELGKEQKISFFEELREVSKRVDYDELIAFILFGDVTEEEDLSCIKTPRSISFLAIELLGIKDDECVADFSCNEKNFVMEAYFNNKNADYKMFNISEEIFDVFYYLRYALVGVGVTNDIRDSMYSEEAEKVIYSKVFFDYCEKVLWEPKMVYPFDTNGISKEWKYLYRILELISDDGQIVAVVPNVCTTSQKDEKVREWFLSNNYMEAVISLPDKMYTGINASFTMLLLSKNNKEISFVNAVGKGQVVRKGAKRMNSFSEDSIREIANAIKEESTLGTKVSVDTVLENGCVISPNTYCIESNVGLDSVEFQEVINHISRGVQLPGNELDQLISETKTEYKYLTPANIIDGRIQVDLPYLAEVNEKHKKYVANKDDIVISKNAEPFKIALVEEENLLISSNLYKVTLDKNKINPLYLKGYLESETGQSELKRISSGGITMTLGVEALKRLQISCPPLEEQEKIVQEYRILSDDILKKQKEIEEILNLRKCLFS